MPLLRYIGWVGSFLVAALFAASWYSSVPIALSRPSDVPLNQRINIRIHTDQKWPERVVFDTSRWRLAPAENEPQGQKPSQGPIAVEWLDPVEAFAEMGRELSMTVCSRPAWPTRIRNRTLSRNARPASSGLEVSRAAKAFTAPNPFHKLPGKS
jgi:hypothetical protein